MQANRSVSPGWLKSVLLASAVLAGAAFVGHGADPAYASHTEIVFSKSSTSPTTVTTLTFVIGGPAQTVYVWAKNVDDPQGAAAFDVRFTYNSSVATITALTEQSTWLASTGRSVACPVPVWASGAPYVRAVPDDPNGLWEGQVSCVTIGAPPPFGPNCANNNCDGLLAIITIAPGPIGRTLLDLTWGSQLIDTGSVSGGTVVDPAVIPALRRSLTVRVIHCADINGDNVVTLAEILALAGRFGMASSHPNWDGRYDLDKNGTISLSDVLDGAAQFGRSCP